MLEFFQVVALLRELSLELFVLIQLFLNLLDVEKFVVVENFFSVTLLFGQEIQRGLVKERVLKQFVLYLLRFAITSRSSTFFSAPHF